VPTRPDHDSTRSTVHTHLDDSKHSWNNSSTHDSTHTNTGSFEVDPCSEEGKRAKPKPNRRHQSMPKRRTSQVGPRRITQGTGQYPEQLESVVANRTSRTRLGRRQTTTNDSLRTEDGENTTRRRRRRSRSRKVDRCQRRALCVPERRRTTATQQTLQHIEHSL